MILSNIEIRWARLDPLQVDMGYDKATPQWNLQAITRDKKQAEEWKSAGLAPKPDTDDTGIFYRIQVKKLATNKDGSPAKPVIVVGSDLMPFEDPSRIGNGTIANVKVRTFDYDFQGRKGVGLRLEAVQITQLEAYEGAGGGALAGFEAFDVDDTSFDGEDAFA